LTHDAFIVIAVAIKRNPRDLFVPGPKSMHKTPSVSIVAPFLNTENYIAQAIESVLSQTYEQWELLLVDDGSSDASTEIARRFAEQHPGKVHYLEHDEHRNLGASASRNFGWRHSRSPYIAYLDADDVWLPEKLERQVALLDAHPDAGMVIGATKYWYSWTGRSEDADRDKVIMVGAPQDTLFQPRKLLKLLYPLGRGAAPSINTVLVRKDVMERIGGWEDTFRAVYTDQAFLVKVYLNTPVYVASECWDLYRQRPDSSMHVNLAGTKYHSVRLQFLTWFKAYLMEQGLEGTETWVLLERAMWPYQHPVLNRVRNRVGQFGQRFVRNLERFGLVRNT
jgi:glycosyltransferase involved in cell wall biosynthesis